MDIIYCIIIPDVELRCRCIIRHFMLLGGKGETAVMYYNIYYYYTNNTTAAVYQNVRYCVHYVPWNNDCSRKRLSFRRAELQKTAFTPFVPSLKTIIIRVYIYGRVQYNIRHCA